MNTDGYTPTILMEEILRLSRVYGPLALTGEHLPADHAEVLETIERLVSPCIRGEPCVVESLAVEFERLAAAFRQHKVEIQSTSCPDCEERWTDEGGQVLRG